MRRFFGFLFQLLGLAIAVVVLTVLWMIFDGLNDVGDKADVALVTGEDDPSAEAGVGHARLDKVARLYRDGVFPAIILSSQRTSGAGEERATMRKYLQDHGVASDAIVEDRGASNTLDSARDVSEMMREHAFGSVMLVTDYYRVTRLRLALGHAGVKDITKNHVGSARIDDAFKVAHEVLALYVYIGETFIAPAAEKIKNEAQVGVDKAKDEAEKAKEKIDKSLDDLPSKNR